MAQLHDVQALMEASKRVEERKKEMYAEHERNKQKRLLKEAELNRTHKNAYYWQAYRAAQNAVSQFAEIKKELAALDEKQKAGRIGEKDYAEQREKINAKRMNVQSDAQAIIGKAYSEFAEMLKQYEQIDSAKINTADMDLLKYADITAEHLQSLAKKHEHNPTMLNILQKQAKDKGFTPLSYTTGEQRLAAFEKIIRGMQAAVEYGLEPGYAQKSLMDADSHEMSIARDREVIGDIDAIAQAVGKRLVFGMDGEHYA